MDDGLGNRVCGHVGIVWVGLPFHGYPGHSLVIVTMWNWMMNWISNDAENSALPLQYSLLYSNRKQW